MAEVNAQLGSNKDDHLRDRPFYRRRARPFATLNARKAVRDLAPQTPSAGPFRNPSSISRFCAAIISLGGGFNLLAPCNEATTPVPARLLHIFRDERIKLCS